MCARLFCPWIIFDAYRSHPLIVCPGQICSLSGCFGGLTEGLVFLLGLVLLHRCVCTSCRHTAILFPRRWLPHQQHMAKPTRQAALARLTALCFFNIKGIMRHLWKVVLLSIEASSSHAFQRAEKKHWHVNRLFNVLHIHLLLLWPQYSGFLHIRSSIYIPPPS